MLALLLLACGPKPAPPEPALVDPLAPAQLAETVGALASDEMQGRGSFEPGIERAADYIVGRFEAAGLQPMPGEDALLKPVTLYQMGWDAEATGGAATVGDWSMDLTLGEDLRPFPFSDAGELSAPVVFAGYGITAPEFEWDDYAGLDVEGKWVLVLRHEPLEVDEGSAFQGAGMTDHAAFVAKARQAQEHGALGLLVVTDPLNHQGAEDLRLSARSAVKPTPPKEPRPEEASPEEASPEEAAAPPAFLAAQLSQPATQALLAQAGLDLAELQRQVDAGTPAAELSLEGAELRLRIATDEVETEREVNNVVGFLPGRDPEAAWVVVGAHYDHLGAYAGEGDTIYNGADDNASGTAGLIALAEAMTAREAQPYRSVLFVAFTGEESGLLGSRAMLAQDQLQAEDIAFMLNLDMIGRLGDKELGVTGDAFTVGLSEELERLGAELGLGVDLRGFDYFGNSDHHPFHQAGVPSLHVFTGLHEDYHQLSDHADKIDVEGMSRVLAVSLGLLEHYADAEARPARVHQVPWLSAKVLADNDTVRVIEVEEGSPLQAGDLLLAVKGEPLSSAYAVGEALQAVKPGTEASLSVQRGEEMVTVHATRPKPGYLGVWPAPVSDELRAELKLPEGEGVLLQGVVPDGPSAAAGLLEGDVIYGLNGVPVDIGNLGQVLARIGGGETIPVRLIREGERMELELTLGVRE
ncbi:MAG: M20/M25/M40 family metallo-hydrolase [Alphaproteobacteria bacterium]|nr:M20/M25/M40 family metallo-hydrolase [Alphaproteobacteria bacterium]